MISRKSIFIGHATPEDNEFTLWLQSKLINEGYECECDLSFLLGGEADYWKKIQDFLEFNTVKYILIVSSNTFEKQGVLDEWEFCKGIIKTHRLSDFIIPVKIDNSSYIARIGLNRMNIISFEDNWAIGLRKLLKKLKNDNVPKLTPTNLSLQDWYENAYTNWPGIKKDLSDKFYSNWLNIEQLPKVVYFYKYYNETQAKYALENTFVYPAFRHGNIIISFQKGTNYQLGNRDPEIQPVETIIKEVNCAFTRYEDDDFPSYPDFRRLLVRLLNCCFEKFIQDKDLLSYGLSNSKCYYFKHDALNKNKGRFYINDKVKNIGVTGKYYDDQWHFAISFKALLYPFPCFSIKNHIIFSDKDNTAWTDPKKMHSARRDKGKTMRNKEWRNQLLSFLSLLSDNENNEIIIPVAENESFSLSTTPQLFQADFSYIEPNDLERTKSIDDFDEEEDFYINQENVIYD